MPAPHPPGSLQRAVELARLPTKPVREIAKDLGISGSCLRDWLAQAIRPNPLLPRPIRHRSTSPTRCCDDRLNPPAVLG